MRKHVRRKGIITPFEQEVLDRMTAIEAQVLRDAYLERSETPEQMADRTGIPLQTVLDFKRVRYKQFVKAEISIERGRHYPRVSPEDEDIAEQQPRCVRHTIPREVQDMAEGLE